MGMFRQELAGLKARYGVWRGLLVGILAGILLLGISHPALASLTDDRYDGNIFALYAGNGAIVPPKVTLSESIQQHKPTLLFLYVDDSSDCKRDAFVISQLQAPYGRVVNFVPVMADSIPVKASYAATEPGYYFQGGVPHTVIFDEDGNVRFNQIGELSYEAADDVFRTLFDLLPRAESVELRRRPVNELNQELVPE
jgi:hypothetical protein